MHVIKFAVAKIPISRRAASFASKYELGKISAKPHTIVKQICFPNGNLLFLSLFSLSKNWMHNVVWGCAEILPWIVIIITIVIIISSQSKFHIIIS